MARGEIPDLFGPPDETPAVPTVTPGAPYVRPHVAEPNSAAASPPAREAQTRILGTAVEELEFDPLSVRSEADDVSWDSEGLAAFGIDLESVRPPALVAPITTLEPAVRGGAPEAPRGGAPVAPLVEATPAAPSVAVFALELGLPEEGAAPNALAPVPLSAAAPASPAPGRASVAPPAAPQQARREAPPDLSSFGNLGMDLGAAGFDLDAEMSGNALPPIAEAPREEEEGPFPTARTPAGEDFHFDAGQLRAASGFGPAPSSIFTTPVYFLRVSAGLRQLAASAKERSARLGELEAARDRILGEFAESKRAELSEKDRFVGLYREADDFVGHIAEAERVVAALDQSGAAELAALEAELEVARAEASAAERARAERKDTEARGQANVDRAKAAIRRVEIEMRNVADRARQVVKPGELMPPELGARYLALGEDKKRLEPDFERVRAEQKSLVRASERAEDDHRRTLALLGAIEARKQGVMMAHEGDMKAHVEALELARSGQKEAIAKVGRAIVDLHGEVPIPREVRQALLACDTAIAAAARELELVVRAKATLDTTAFGQGRAVLVGAALLSLLSLLWALFA